MRIQHNIAALNSYRQLSGNNSAVSKNLEKLSSGYKINRAGDDAAGLAISEKMRAQITGLETAQKNANDGISLVQTAEGALTEVHSMLNRMVELADQSANGTYDDTVDRANLQKEVNSLLDEINRISESTNFNGINLLDGSLGGPKVSTVAGTADVAGTVTPGTAATVTISTITAVRNGDKVGDFTFTGADLTEIDGKDVTVDGVTYTAASGAQSITLTAKSTATVVEPNTTNIEGAITINGFTAAGNVAKTDGTADTTVGAATGTATVSTFDFNGRVGEDMIGGTITIGDTTFEFVETGKTAAAGNTAISIAKDAAAADIATAFQTAVGTNVTGWTAGAGDTTTSVKLTSDDNGAEALKIGFKGFGINLQVGDTSDSFNKVKVSVSDMSASALGLEGLDISNQTAAAGAIDKIRTAINSVSSTRGDLGAVQNRLEHTINNLSVTTENMTAAESRIRDTDMAEEMMAYTKNNILVQAAQAMLAQANQIPQGVLQLLQ